MRRSLLTGLLVVSTMLTACGGGRSSSGDGTGGADGSDAGREAGGGGGERAGTGGAGARPGSGGTGNPGSGGTGSPGSGGAGNPGSGGAGNPGSGGAGANPGSGGAGGNRGSGGSGGTNRGSGGAGGTGGVTPGSGGAAGSPGSGGAAGNTGSGGAPNIACATAVAQQACIAEGVICSSGCTSICSFCNILRCSQGRWQPMEVFPAPCFMCGPDTDTRCQTGAEYCELFYPGIAAQPVQRTCRAMPTACRTTPTCSCLEAERVIGGVNTCQQAGAGELTVTFAAP